MRTFDDRQGTRLFDVKIVYAEPCGGEVFERSKVISAGNCLERAKQMVDGITKQIARKESLHDVGGCQALRAYMEPMDCALPMSDEKRGAMDHVAEADKAAEVDARYAVIMAKKDIAHVIVSGEVARRTEDLAETYKVSRPINEESPTRQSQALRTV